MAEPSLVDAVIARLLATAAVTALTSTRISGRRQDAWDLKTQAAIVVYGPRGGPGDNAPSPGLATERLDLFCYGSNGKNAKDLAAVVLRSLSPLQGMRGSFKAAHTRVPNVRAEGGRIALTDPDTGWEYCVVPVLVTYRMEYAA